MPISARVWSLCFVVATVAVGLAVSMAGAESDQPDPLFRVWVDHKLGYIDTTGKIVIEPKFDGGSCFSEGRAAVMVGGDEYGHGGKWGYIDTTGHYILEPQLVEVPSRWGKLVAPTQPAKDFSEGLAAVLVKGKWGFIDRSGRIAIAPRFEDEEDAGPFREGLAAVRVRGRFGYIDRSGKLVIAPQFEYTHCFSEGLAAVAKPASKERETRYGYIDKSGAFLIRPRFIFAHDFHDGLAFVQSAHGVHPRKWPQGGWIDKTGKMVIGPWGFEHLLSTAPPIVDFSEGLVPRRVGDRIGYIGKTGKFVIPARFLGAGSFSEGLAPVFVDDKWGYTDKTGRFVIEPRFRIVWHDIEVVGGFRNGLAEVNTSYDWGYIDRTGRFVWREPTVKQ